MASNNYFSVPQGAAQYSYGYAGAAAQATIVQPGQAAFVAPTYETYPTSQTAASQYAFAARSQSAASGVAADYFSAPVVQAAQVYDPAKAYYAPVAAVAQAPSAAAVYTLPVDATAVYQAAKYPQIYDTAPKTYYPLAAAAAPSAVPTTMYTALPAEPVYQTLAVGAKPVYVANTYPPAVTPARPMATAYKLIQTTPLSTQNAVSIASYAYQPVATPSVYVCSHSIVTTPTAVRTATVSSTAATASSMGRIPSLVSGQSRHFHSSSSSGGAPAAAHTFTSSGVMHHRRSSPWRPVSKGAAGGVSSAAQSSLQMYYCRVCMVHCAGAQAYKEHLDGQRHKKKESSLKTTVTTTAAVTTTTTASAIVVSRAGAVQLHCQLCDVACAGADTYAAHIRGIKHQKVLKLHSTLGKPAGGQSSTGTAAASVDVKKDGESGVDELDGLLGTDSDVQPVGQEYIEEAKNESGVVVGFHCKLCECKFTDPNAKQMHMKGRRHRFQYKKKVDPSLQVDARPLFGRRLKDEHDRKQQDDMRRRYVEDKWRMECDQLRYEGALMNWPPYPRPQSMPPPLPMRPGFFPPGPPRLGIPFGPQRPPMPMRRPDNPTDRQVMAKHAAIYPKPAELEAVQITVSAVEKALKIVSDSFSDSNVSESSGPEPSDAIQSTKPTEETSSESTLLRSVVRVGALAKGLLLRDDLIVHLVVLCSEKPTRTLLDTVADKLTKQLQVQQQTEDEYDVRLCVEEAGLIVNRLTAPATRCNITLTSPIVRKELIAPMSAELASKTDPPDVLDRQKCLDALAEQRRSKWFQARMGGVQSCLIILRIFREMRLRDLTWKMVTDWMLELLVEKCLLCCERGVGSLSPGNALRRIFECIASGILLSGTPGLSDPCEKELTDASDCLTNQQKEEVTASAQNALRLMAFHQVHRVLGMAAADAASQHPRKRPYTQDAEKTEAKKPAVESNSSAQ